MPASAPPASVPDMPPSDSPANEPPQAPQAAIGTGPIERAIVDEPLPKHLGQRPNKPWEWPMPTAWLLGTKILGSLRDIVLSSVAKVDLRNWMTAGEVIDLTHCERTVLTGAVPTDCEPCCYIDFLADTGDSQRLVFQLARLLQKRELEVKHWENGEQRSTVLPRGSVLVLGGDTAYPVATHRRLLERIRAPFQWAHDELSRERFVPQAPVTLLAVPGNHDYYDGLRGFEALAHSPPVVIAPSLRAGQPAEPSLPTKPPPPAEQPLHLAGYQLRQHASYFAAALPFEWQLWGLDIEMREIDDRQLAFFQGAARWKKDAAATPVGAAQEPPAPPEKLIVVTSRPGFVYQGLSDHAKVIEPSFKRLGLTSAFAKQGVLDDDHVRLDLSGDVHLYERYWGTDHEVLPDSVDQLRAACEKGKRLDSDTHEYEAPERYRAASPQEAVRKRGNDKAPPSEASARENYASVVSGLGGAFHHPSQVRRGSTPPCAAWPSAEHSAREIGVRLVDPYEMFRAGAVGIVGVIIAAACYLLGWSNENVLGVPFARPLADIHVRALGQLGLVAAIVGIVLAMIGLPVAAYYLGRVLARPIREMRPFDKKVKPRDEKPPGQNTQAGEARAPNEARAPGEERPPAPKTPPAARWRRAIPAAMDRWLRATRWLTHCSYVARVLALLGANPRSTWLFASTIFAWGGMLVGWWFLGHGFSVVASAVFANKLVVIDVVITVVVVGMAALGAFRGGQKTPLETWGENIVRRICLAGFGAVIAGLVIWTPYAWIRLVCLNWPVSLIGLFVAVLTILVRLGHWIFRRGLRARQIWTWIGFVLLVGGALVLPLRYAQMDGPAATPSPLHWFVMFMLVLVVGAYFACLWVGWYFCICLQWNRHGNEAGSAARVTDFGAFLRIKLTADRAEVWAISVEEHLDDNAPFLCRVLRRKVRLVDPVPTARLIDHFTVARASSGRAPSSS